MLRFGSWVLGLGSVRTLVINPAHGVAGDMLMAAMATATQSFAALAELFAPLEAMNWCSLDFQAVDRSSLRATHCVVNLRAEAPKLSLVELQSWVKKLLDEATGIKIAQRALELLGLAEEEVHGSSVHLHELASVDTLVDVVGTAYLCATADVDAVSVMPIGLHFGSLEMAHGQFPLPGPAVLSLLANARLPVVAMPGQESVTPTGAALLAALVTLLPHGSGDGVIAGVGYGAGTRDTPGVANVCQVVLVDDQVDAFGDARVEIVGVIETYLDDVSGELLGNCIQESLEAGALDAYITPATGKKSRPGVLLTVLVDPNEMEAMVSRIQRSLGTPGVRFRLQQRRRFVPSFREVEVEGQTLMVKVTPAGAKPEFEDLRRVAEVLGVPLGELRDRVMSVYRSLSVNGGGRTQVGMTERKKSEEER
ncbi:LarC family nickel insertion protein [Ferrimicrobium sp.]|uniref:LarC family nickel insertion protein n=1 Tax=Ferrimicrobium sp. TaxID=2926050 RepID=UPI00262D0557|nr:LarC family nickel insertion protein [Ferrimicrobium sp.]